MSRRHPHVVHLDEIEARTTAVGTRFGSQSKRLGAYTGGAQLGCTWYEVAPGHVAYPKHYHCLTEEAYFILEGEAVLRTGVDDEVAVKAGDYIACPVGPGGGHQIVNRSNKPVRYLCMSASSSPVRVDVVVYPDSNKFAAMATDDPKAWENNNFWVREIQPVGKSLGYYDGEDVG